MAISKKATLEITNTLDRVAGLISQDYKALGIPSRVASDFVGRVDSISDYLWKRAGIALPTQASASNGGVDPSQIGQTEGPAEYDSDEPYVQEYDQNENRELQERVEGDGLGKAASILSRLARLKGLSDSDFRKLAAKLAEEEEEDDAMEAEEDGEEDSSDKKASAKRYQHGFNLSASDEEDDTDED